MPSSPIPAAASPGLWDLHVNSLLLEDAFTVIQAVPAILSISPNSAEQGTSFTGTVNGQYTNWTGTPSVYLSYSGNPGEIITGSNVTVINGTQLTALFAVPSDASPGLYTIHVDALQLANAFTVIEVVPAIQFMSPNFAHQGDSFTASVFGENTSWSGTPSVSLSYSLNPSEVITGTNVNVVSNTEITVDFSVPANASTGNYTLHVDDLAQSNAFTVLATLIPALSSISPDNGEQGTLVSTTISGENTTFTSGNPSVSISLHSNPSEIINAQDVSVVNNTTLSADFDIPIDATPGLWDLHVDDLLLENAFTVIDAVPYLVSIDPNSAYQGQQVLSLVTAANTAFTLSAPSISLSFSGNPEDVINSTSVNVLSDTEVEAVFDIPADALVGTYDLHVDDLVLEGSFTVNLLIGIGEAVTQSIRMYPNPASQNYFIENATGADVDIFDASGKTIEGFKISSDKQALDVSHLTSGVYYIRVMVNGKAETKKLIVN